ncbi:lmo0514 family class 1 internalin [Listeria monocytogenes]|uniref:lmo0514 family class 1 internalin n=1 Tax=Listeria monocytogenes TaxID=1639 RepID=UPI001E45BBEF|nr:lmo0514 family class 1 internalin [Listeria monocytogenes]EHT4840788.1 lmo0514 family class 1 internalin [Listeria monocytogenes]EKC9516387.1 lmo0514 family class 1 internalin [Listeria monocytogenes]MCD2251478.1 lmo0514 family class 1 internalin [Listeria monocytogenes]
MKKALKLFLAMICMFIMIYPSTAAHAEETNIVNIPDANLKTYLNGLLKQASDAPITKTQMNTIQTVTLSGSTYTDLTGLEEAGNLVTLSINNTNIQTLEPIKNQTSLTYLTVGGDNVKDSLFVDLNGLVNLQSLSINGSEVTHNVFKTFNKLPKLTYLYAQNSMKITDISALASLPALTTLFLQFDGIDDFRPLNDFESFKNGNLKALAAFGQNTGRTNPRITLKSGKLDYNETNQTLYLPFSMMPKPLTSFDGTVAPFSKSTSASNTYLGFNDVALPSSRLSITDDGITVSGVTKEEFDNLDEIEYNARYDFPTGSYPTPPSMTSYTISSGTYDQYFDISHTLDLTADESFDYNQYDTTSEEQFLKDVHAETDDGTAVKSNFDQVVKLDVPGEYTVTLNAENAAGLKATPVTVKVTVHEKPVITSDSQISYKKETTKSVDEFLKEIHGSVTGNAVLTSDFDKVVDLNTPGEYTVTLNAINDRGQKADPVTVVVTVTTSDSGHVDPVPPTPEIKPTPQEETDQTIIPEPQSETTEDPVKEDQAKDGQAKSEEKADKTSLTTKENKVEKSEKTNQPKTKALPQTGDTNKTALPIAGVMLSLAALLIFRKSKS